MPKRFEKSEFFYFRMFLKLFYFLMCRQTADIYVVTFGRLPTEQFPGFLGCSMPRVLPFNTPTFSPQVLVSTRAEPHERLNGGNDSLGQLRTTLLRNGDQNKDRTCDKPATNTPELRFQRMTTRTLRQRTGSCNGELMTYARDDVETSSVCQ